MKNTQPVCNLAALAVILVLLSLDAYMVSDAEEKVILGCETHTAVDKSGSLYCAQCERHWQWMAEK